MRKVLLVAFVATSWFATVHSQTCANSLVPNCNNCYKPKNECQKCAPAHVLSASKQTCIACSANCNKCTEYKADKESSCTACPTTMGFFRNRTAAAADQFECLYCGAGCATCNNKQTCDTCMAGYTKSFTTTACTGCAVSQCADCGDNKNLCFKCNKGYFLNAKKDLCTKCSGGCLDCVNADSCIECPTLQFFDKTSKSCKSCRSNCKTGKCDINNGCTECNTGYYLSDNGATTEDKKLCISCGNCPTGSCDPTKKEGCTTCNTGYAKFPGHKSHARPDNYCNKCPAYQSTGSNSGTSTAKESCVLSSPSSSTTDDTWTRTWDSATGRCVYCPKHCKACSKDVTQTLPTYTCDVSASCGTGRSSKDGVCITCQEIDGLKCTKCSTNGAGNCDTTGHCPSGYVLENMKCTKCWADGSNLCTSCSAAGKCNSGNCPAGYRFVSSDNTCEKCDVAGCKSCQADKTYCEMCMANMYPRKGPCRKCDVANCAACTGRYQCTTCATKYTLNAATGVNPQTSTNPDTCVPCVDNCDNCDGQGDHTTQTGKKQCVSTRCTANTNTGLFSGDGACTTCTENCNDCDNQVLTAANSGKLKCKSGQCKDGVNGASFGLVSSSADGVCIACVPNCVKCDGETLHTTLTSNLKCKQHATSTSTYCSGTAGMGMQASDGQCVACSQFCNACDNKPLSGVTGQTTKLQCVVGSCQSNYGQEAGFADSTCLPCVTNCDSCQGEAKHGTQTTALKCKAAAAGSTHCTVNVPNGSTMGMQNGDGKCTPCTPNCNDCDNMAETATAGQLKCDANGCASKFGLENAATDGICYPCVTNCVTCTNEAKHGVQTSALKCTAAPAGSTHCTDGVGTTRMGMKNGDGACAPCTPNCHDCDDQADTATAGQLKCDTGGCDSKFGLESGATDGLCLGCVPNCVTCTNEAKHGTLNTQLKCSAAPAGLTYCTDGVADGTYMGMKNSDGECKPCTPHCTDCDDQADTATAGELKCDTGGCKANYGLENAATDGICYECVTNCKLCTNEAKHATQNTKLKCTASPSSTNCDVNVAGGIVMGMKNADGACVECSPNCKVCDDQAAGVADASKLQCKPNECDANYGILTGADKICKPCVTGCSNCEGQSYHTVQTANLKCNTHPTADSSYCSIAGTTAGVQNADGACKACTPNCVDCDDKAVVAADNTKLQCVKCSTSGSTKYGLVTATGTCSACTANCNSCNAQAVVSGSTILQCIDGNCAAGYGKLTAVGTCVSCTANCADCDLQSLVLGDSVLKCKSTSCQAGSVYDVSTGRCNACLGKVETIDSIDYEHCTACTSGLYQCSTCPPGYYDYKVRGCSACPNDNICADCLKTRGTKNANMGTVCDTKGNCASGKYLDAASTAADPCTACGAANCVNCDSAGDKSKECSTCSTGFYLDTTTKTCMSCTKDCDTCDPTKPDKCTRCAAGKILIVQNTATERTVCLDAFISDQTTCEQCANAGGIIQARVWDVDHCVDCPPYCTACTANGACTTCLKGYHKDAGDSKCTKCASHVNCIECTSATTCSQCSGNMYADGATCQSCSKYANCATCDSAKCLTCNANTATYVYSMNSDSLNCRQCSVGCNDCSGQTADNLCDTDKCNDYYFFDSDKKVCTACPSKCKSCKASITCSGTACTAPDCDASKCDAGSYRIEPASGAKTCSNCGVSNCAKCPDKTGDVRCTTCAGNYYKSTGTTADTCIKCATQCKTCSQAGCSECNTGYFLNVTESGDAQCRACSDTTWGAHKDCSVCSNTNNNVICHACTTGNCLNAATNPAKDKICLAQECLTCLEHPPPADSTVNEIQCLTCRSKTEGIESCQACDNNCVKCDVNGKGKCDVNSCKTGFYYIAATKTCGACNDISLRPHCVTCKESGTDVLCESCFNTTSTQSYTLKSNKCYKCAAMCTACSVDNQCDSGSCMTGSYFHTVSKSCPTCSSSVGNCKTCGSDNQNKVTCNTCNTGYVFNATANICEQCDTNCKVCNTNRKGKCDPGMCNEEYYFKSADKLCTKCLSNCANCTSGSLCQDCKHGYFLSSDNKTCTKCDSDCATCKNNGTNGQHCTSCNPGFIMSFHKRSCEKLGIDNCERGFDPKYRCTTCAANNHISRDKYSCGRICTFCNTTTDNCVNYQKPVLTGNATSQMRNNELVCNGICATAAEYSDASATSAKVFYRGCLDTAPWNIKAVCQNNAGQMCHSVNKGGATVRVCMHCCDGDRCNDVIIQNSARNLVPLSVGVLLAIATILRVL